VASVYFDSGAVVRFQLRNGDDITGVLQASVTPGGEEFVVGVEQSVPRHVRVSEIQTLKIPYPGTSFGVVSGASIGGLATLAHDGNTTGLVVAGIVAGSVVGGAIGSQVTRWLTVAERSDLGSLMWIPRGPELVPVNTFIRRFVASCFRGDSTGEVLVGVVGAADGPFFTEVQSAWAVDTVLRQMRRIPATDIRCRNEEWETRLSKASAGDGALALRFTPSPGKAMIYVHQRTAWNRVDPELEIVLDGARVGRTSPGTYRVFEVNPGAHLVGVLDHEKKALVIEAAADSVYFVGLRDKRGVRRYSFGGIERISDQARARELISAAQLLRP
jgi:hypothetical protein